MLDFHVAYLGFAGHVAFSRQVGAIFLDYQTHSYYKMANGDRKIKYECVCWISLGEHHHTDVGEWVCSSQSYEGKWEGASD